MALVRHHPCPCTLGRMELSAARSYLVMLLQLRMSRCKQGRRSTSAWSKKEKEEEMRGRSEAT